MKKRIRKRLYAYNIIRYNEIAFVNIYQTDQPFDILLPS